MMIRPQARHADKEAVGHLQVDRTSAIRLRIAIGSSGVNDPYHGTNLDHLKRFAADIYIARSSVRSRDNCHSPAH